VRLRHLVLALAVLMPVGAVPLADAAPATPSAYDYVDLGDATSEQAHNLTASASSGTSVEAGRTRRYAGINVANAYFEFDAQIAAGSPFLLRAVETFDGNPGISDYYVYVNGTRVQTHSQVRPGTATTNEYVIAVTDPALLQSGTVRVRFQEDEQGQHYEPSIADVWTEPLPPSYDYVDLGEPTSEQAHNLSASASSGTTLEGGRTRRYTGATVPSSYFEFDAKIATGTPFLIRVDETFNADPGVSDYSVLVNGTTVHVHSQPRPGAAGINEYTIPVDDPALLQSDTVRIRFQEDAQGANFDPSIADVWTEPVGASISGTVHDDLNGNGAVDPGEGGLGGVAVSLGASHTTTAADGSYAFGGLGAGSYSVDYTPPPGYLNSGPRPRAVQLAEGQASPGHDFFAQPPASAPPGPWDAFNLAPASRTVQPVAVYRTTGTVGNANGVLSGGTTTITGSGSSVTLDFGKEVGGFVSLHFGSSTSAAQSVGLTYSEWSTYVSTTTSDGSNGGSNSEPPVQYAVTPGSGIDTETSVPTAGAGTNTSTTLSVAVPAGATTMQVASTSLLSAGKKINVGTGANLDTGKITAVGSAASTTLSSVALIGDTNIKVASVANFAAGKTITIDSGSLLENAVVTAVGTAGATGTGITFTPALTLVHPPTRAVVQPASITLTPALSQAHPSGAVVFQRNSELRGGFRYLTVVNETSGTLALDGASVRITFAPDLADLRAYANYFYSDDTLLNRIWYAGAYTVETNIIPNDQGRVWGAPSSGWNNSALVGESGNTVHVDGAKRDRTVWPGDLGISVPSDYASLGDLVTVRNSLHTLYNHQAGSGALPYAGPAVNFIGNSDAYHMWTLIGTATYYQYSSDKAWLDSIWGNYKLALNYIVAKIGADNLLNVTQSADWARTDSGGKNIEAEAIMYRTLITCQTLATVEGDSALAASCASKAAALKSAVNTAGYWDPAQNLYRNVPSGTSSTLYPQDGNSLAVWFDLVDTSAKADAISQALGARWVAVGALTPEKSASSVHPFPGSMEVMAHFVANEDVRGLDLIRLEWGYMLNAPYGTASTFWEGYKTDGTSDYSGSYISAAHGWSTGPTSALSFYVLGIDPGTTGGATYRLVPHPGDLHHVEGQLATPWGVIRSSYSSDAAAGTFDEHFDAPAGAVTEIGVPTFGRQQCVILDGQRVWDGTAGSAYNAHSDGTYVYLDGVPGGAHHVSAAPAPCSPTAVTLRSFTARAVRGGVELRWATAQENGLLGFEVYRGRVKLNRALIPARGRPSAYHFFSRAKRGTYRLDAVNQAGARAWHATARVR
jgi:hypothetical protein